MTPEMQARIEILREMFRQNPPPETPSPSPKEVEVLIDRAFEILKLPDGVFTAEFADIEVKLDAYVHHHLQEDDDLMAFAAHVLLAAADVRMKDELATR